MRSFEFAMREGKKQFEGAQLPEYQTKHSAGADFFCAETVTIPSLFRDMVAQIRNMFVTGTKPEGVKPTLVHTGIKANMENDEVLELYNRSSNPLKKGLILANGVGVVDKDYYSNEANDGEIMFAFYNYMPWEITIEKGERIGQGVFKKFLRPEVGLVVKEEDRTGGFGSTEG